MKAMQRPPAAVAQLGRALEPIWGKGRLKVLLGPEPAERSP